jgi:hypothetical protein
MANAHTTLVKTNIENAMLKDWAHRPERDEDNKQLTKPKLGTSGGRCGVLSFRPRR